MLKLRFHKFHWADRAALIVAAFLVACCLMASAVALIAVGGVHYLRFDAVLAEWCGYALAAGTIPLWLGLRLVALIGFGWSRLRAATPARAETRNEPAVGNYPNAVGWR